MKKSHRTHAADAERRVEADRARAARAFFGDEDLSHDETDALDLADDVDDAMPSTVTVKGLRAAEEA